MKKHLHIALATALLISVFTVCAQAQSRSQQQLIVDVSFAFNIGDTQLPAGEYRVNVVNPSAPRSVLQIRSADGKSSALLQTTDIIGRSSSRAKLTFRHYNDQYFLAQVWMAAEPTGFAAPNSRVEKELQQQIGKAKKNTDLVAIKAR